MAKPALIPEDILSSYAAYGCKVNAISAEALFERYAEAGFLYTTKLERLKPFLPIILENLRKGMKAGELIHYVTTFENSELDAWAAVSAWRTTLHGWQFQHLVSVGSPLASRAVMLSNGAKGIHDHNDFAFQNWFRPTNRFAARVFGSLSETMGPTLAWIDEFQYMAVTRSWPPNASTKVQTCRCEWPTNKAVANLIGRWRSNVFASGSELLDEDFELAEVDELYRLVGLRRYRQIWLGYCDHNDEPSVIAIAYRGPLGFNFSFLENRCEIIAAPELTEAQFDGIFGALINQIAPFYSEFVPGFIPVVVDRKSAPLLRERGAEPLQSYCQSMWLREGFQSYYRHIEKFYVHLLKFGKHRGVGGTVRDAGERQEKHIA